MYRLICVLFSLFLSALLFSQNRIPTLEDLPAPICTLPAPEPGHYELISKPFKFSNNQRSVNYTITYAPNGSMVQGKPCKTWPAAAQTALDYAMSIWSDILQSETQDLGIVACWTDSLGTNTLGSAGSNGYIALSDTAHGLGAAYYPSAVGEYLLNESLSTYDIVSFFNAQRTDWYFGVDALTPFNKIDFVSVALHEICHGLGFQGSARIDSANNGLVGYDYPFIYDVFVDDELALPILDLVSPSTDIYDVLTGGEGSLLFDDTNLSYFRSPDQTYSLHTPTVYAQGSSYSHFSETSLGNELMSPIIGYGQGIHQVNYAEIVLKEIGWNYIALPIQLTSFTASQEAQAVRLTWTTDYEYQNDHYEIERSSNAIDFIKIGRIEALDSRGEIKSYSFDDQQPQDGLSYYRLKQVDTDGRYSYSDIISILFKSAANRWSCSPNPAGPFLSIDLPEKNEAYTLFVYDQSGKLVLQKTMSSGKSVIDSNIFSSGPIYLNLKSKVVDLGWEQVSIIK